MSSAAAKEFLQQSRLSICSYSVWTTTAVILGTGRPTSYFDSLSTINCTTPTTTTCSRYKGKKNKAWFYSFILNVKCGHSSLHLI